MFGIKDGKVEGWKTNISLFCLVEKKKNEMIESVVCLNLLSCPSFKGTNFFNNILKVIFSNIT